MMASRWSTEHLVTEHKELQASAMAVDQRGQLALLAGKRCLAVVNLENSSQGSQKVPRLSKWEINTVQWNPHISYAYYFVTACNQRAELWTWDDARKDLTGSLKAHTRVISDLDWSPFNPYSLATCSVDTFTFLWDIRDYRKPTHSLQGISGASQVKWNKVNSHLLATCHEGDIRVWDPRKGNTPVQYIAGHLSKIFGLDWSPVNECQLATSSQDCTVKFWDINTPRQSINRLTTTGSPVWRARYTPFGQGLVTVVVPQLRRGENSLFLWDLSQLQEPVHTFVGHTDVVLEFQWRALQKGSKNYQLVTWSKDQSLRLWTVDTQLQKTCGAERDIEDDMTQAIVGLSKEVESPEAVGNNATSAKQPFTEDGSTVEKSQSYSHGTGGQSIHIADSSAEHGQNKLKMAATPPRNGQNFRTEDINMRSPHQPKTLQQEFTLVNFENVTLDETDISRRTCTVSVAGSSGKTMVKLKMTFPEDYPNNVAPTFSLLTSTIDKENQADLIKALQVEAEQHVKYCRSCIEPCLRQLVMQIESIKVNHESNDESNSQSPSFKLAQAHKPSGYFNSSSHKLPSFGFIQDQSVPFPRTSGARFSAAGLLVCFTRKAETAGRISSADVTPRAMSQLSAYSQGSQGQISRTPHGQIKTGQVLFALQRSPPSGSNVQLHNYYLYKDSQSIHHSLKDRKKAPRARSRSRQSDSDATNVHSPKKDKDKEFKARVGPVIIYDVHKLSPVDRQLAETYITDNSDIQKMCTQNASMALFVGRRDLVQLWSLLGVTTKSVLRPKPGAGITEPWAYHPFGRHMLMSLVNYYSAVSDVQTLAMISCALGSKCNTTKLIPISTEADSKYSPDQQVLQQHPEFQTSNSSNYKTYHTVHPTDTSLRNWAISVSKMKRSSSLSDVLGDYAFTLQKDTTEKEKEMASQNTKLLDLTKSAQYDQYKCLYADILYQLGLLEQRAQILKYVSTAPEPHKGIEFKSNCFHCGDETRGAQCWHNHCRRYAFRCDICHVSVRGASSFCLACGHGGHSFHIMQWFKTHDVCPTGCGCNCLLTNPMTFGKEEEI